MAKTTCLWMLVALAILALKAQAQAQMHPALQELGEAVYAWRLQNQPFDDDDVTRLERPAGWLPEWSPAAIAKADAALQNLEQRLAAIDLNQLSRPEQVNYLLLRSELERADFERHVMSRIARDPDFYLAQSCGVVYNYVLRPAPFDERRAAAVIRQIEQIPETLDAARLNLTSPVGPLADRALARLANIAGKLDGLAQGLAQVFPSSQRATLKKSCAAAARSLAAYAAWLKARRPEMAPLAGIGREKYDWLLRRLLLLPMNSDELLVMATQDWRRAEAFEAYEANRNAGAAPSPLATSVAEQQQFGVRGDQQLREFLIARKIVEVPEWMPHFRFEPIPDYLAAFDFGAEIYMFSPSHPREDFIRFIHPPQVNMGFWGKILASDPRPVVAHEGIPGHAFHLRLIDTQADPIRRRHYDGAAVEGLGTYLEEMLLQHGAFDDVPGSRQVVYRMLKLRALRVIMDINVASGKFSIGAAGKFLAENVPMDEATAFEEANWAAASPGQNVGYFAGKVAITQLLAEVRRAQGEAFNLYDFHTRLWKAGAVPASLLRWEWLGQEEDVQKVR